MSSASIKYWATVVAAAAETQSDEAILFIRPGRVPQRMGALNSGCFALTEDQFLGNEQPRLFGSD